MCSPPYLLLSGQKNFKFEPKAHFSIDASYFRIKYFQPRKNSKILVEILLFINYKFPLNYLKYITHNCNSPGFDVISQ